MNDLKVVLTNEIAHQSKNKHKHSVITWKLLGGYGISH